MSPTPESAPVDLAVGDRYFRSTFKSRTHGSLSRLTAVRKSDRRVCDLPRPVDMVTEATRNRTSRDGCDPSVLYLRRSSGWSFVRGRSVMLLKDMDTDSLTMEVADDLGVSSARSLSFDVGQRLSEVASYVLDIAWQRPYQRTRRKVA